MAFQITLIDESDVLGVLTDGVVQFFVWSPAEQQMVSLTGPEAVEHYEKYAPAPI